jgi:hypothetical protein
MIETDEHEEAFMSENQEQATATGEQDASEIQSPSEKLEGQPAEGSPIPGAENPDSTEVKEEINPNTE